MTQTLQHDFAVLILGPWSKVKPLNPKKTTTDMLCKSPELQPRADRKGSHIGSKNDEHPLKPTQVIPAPSFIMSKSQKSQS